MTVAFAVMAVAVVAFCATLLGAPNVKASGSEFADLKIVGAQLRLDEGNEEMRFVAEMSADEFASLSEQSNGYSLGILVAETDSLHGAALEYPAGGGTSSITVYDLTPSDKIEYTVGQTTTYRFNAKLSGNITSAAKKYTARAFVKDDSGAIIKYSNECVRSASEVAGEYISDAALDAADKTKAKEFVVSAYNEKFGKTVADFNAMKADLTGSIAGIKLDGNDLNDATVMVEGNGNNVFLATGEAVTGKLSSDLEGIVRVTYSTSDNSTATVTNGVLNCVKREEIKIKASACGGELTAEDDFVVLDETAFTMGKDTHRTNDSGGNPRYGTTYGNAMDFLNGEAKLSPTAYGAFNWWSSNGTAQYADNATDEIVAKANDRVKNGKVVKFTYNDNVSNDTYVAAKIDYTKEQIDSLIQLGYTNIVCPVYMEVADDANGLQSAKFNIGARKWLDLYTPNLNITGENVPMGYTASYRDSHNRSRIYANEWTYITVPLKVIADNYTQFTTITGNSATDSYDNRRWSLFGIDTTKYGESSGISVVGGFKRTLYFGDFTIEKSNVQISQGEKVVIDLSDPTVRAGINVANKFNYSNSAASNHIDTGFLNKDLNLEYTTTPVHSINGGNWITFSDTQADYSTYTVLSDNGGIVKYVGVFMNTLGYSKEQLETFDQGQKKKCLSFDLYFENLFGTRDQGITLKWGYTSKWDGATTETVKIAATDLHFTVTIPLSTLTENYDKYFTATAAERIPILTIDQEMTAFGWTAFIGNMRLEDIVEIA